MISFRKMVYLSFSQTKKIFQNFTIDSVLPGICICGSDANHVLFFFHKYIIFYGDLIMYLLTLRLWSSLAKHVDVGLTNKTWLSHKYHMQKFYGQHLIPVTKAAIEPWTHAKLVRMNSHSVGISVNNKLVFF